MPQFSCPECDNTNFGTPKLLDKSGYTRCADCNIGIIWKSSLFSRELEAVRTYIPQGASRSPKTGRVLEPERFTRGSQSTLWIFSLFMPLAKKRLEHRKRREGTLKEDTGI